MFLVSSMYYTELRGLSGRDEKTQGGVNAKCCLQCFLSLSQLFFSS